MMVTTIIDKTFFITILGGSMKRRRSLAGAIILLVTVFFCSYLLWPVNLASQSDKTSEAGNILPGQNEEVHLTCQDYTNLISGKKVAAEVLAKVVNPMG